MHDFQHPHLRPLLVTSADNIRNYLYDCAHFTRCNIRTSLFYPRPDRITSSALAAVMTKLLKPNVSMVRYFIKPFPFHLTYILDECGRWNLCKRSSKKIISG